MAPPISWNPRENKAVPGSLSVQLLVSCLKKWPPYASIIWECPLGPAYPEALFSLPPWLPFRFTFGLEYMRIPQVMDTRHQHSPQKGPCPSAQEYSFAFSGPAWRQTLLSYKLHTQSYSFPSSTVIKARLALRAVVFNAKQSIYFWVPYTHSCLQAPAFKCDSPWNFAISPTSKVWTH